MGKTNPTYRDRVEAKREEWESFRRALRYEEQQRFDDLWGESQYHSMAGHSLNPSNPMVTVLMGMMLYQQCQLDELGERIEA